MSFGIPKIDLGKCNEKIKNKYNITNDDLITVLEYEKLRDNDNIISFSLYNPKNGEKLILNDICMNDAVIIQEDLEKKIPNLESFIYLTNQGIDLLNPQNEFYTDLYFHYKSPIDGKDIPLKERFKLFFPNVSLCDKGCFTKGINSTTNTSICECTLNKLITNSFLEENVILQGVMDEFKTLLQDTNIEVLRCYKDLSNSELFSSNYGSFIMIGLILSQVIFTIIYWQKYILSMTKYLFHLMESLSSYLKIKKGENPSNNKLENLPPSIETKLIEFKEAPPKHKPNLNLKNKNNINIFRGDEDKKSMAKSEVSNYKKSAAKKKVKIKDIKSQKSGKIHFLTYANPDTHSEVHLKSIKKLLKRIKVIIWLET